MGQHGDGRRHGELDTSPLRCIIALSQPPMKPFDPSLLTTCLRTRLPSTAFLPPRTHRLPHPTLPLPPFPMLYRILAALALSGIATAQITVTSISNAQVPPPRPAPASPKPNPLL
jgi:hypothetical protein